MNPKALSLFLMILIALSTYSVSAISTDIRESYQPKETLIIEISGNILEPIQKQDIILKRKNVQVPWEYDVKRLGDRYFLWGVTPENENNYTLYINDIATTSNGIVTRIDFNQTFFVTGNLTSYTLKPGFAIFNETFEFDIFLNRDFQESITIDFPEEHQTLLRPGENTLTLQSSGQEGPHMINIGTYTIPIFILKSKKESKGLPSIRFFPRNIESTLLLGSTEATRFPIKIINTQSLEIETLAFQYNSEIFTIENLPQSIGPNEEIEIILIPKIRDIKINEIIFLKSEDYSIEFPILIEYTDEIEKVNTPYLQENYSETQGYYCSELGGQICTSFQECSGETVSSFDSSGCCTGTCSEETQTSYAWVGYLIAGIILIILIIIGGRYLKSRKQKEDPFFKMQKKSGINPSKFSS